MERDWESRSTCVGNQLREGQRRRKITTDSKAFNPITAKRFLLPSYLSRKVKRKINLSKKDNEF